MSRTKYTKELLTEMVKDSVSLAEVMRKLGLREAGGTHSHLSRKLKDYKIDISHFLGRKSNCGKNHKGGPDKLHWTELLVKRKSGRRQTAHRLRRALIESGRDYRCSCGQNDNWHGKKLVLQVNHKNSDWLDNSPNNLEFLCPNCHSQTDGWCGSKGLAEVCSVAKQARVYRARIK